jgi:uncharacterized protein
LSLKTKLVVNLTAGQCLCVSELAENPIRRMRGLLGREALLAGEGLLLRPAPGIHTAFMRFPIDALLLDRDLQVLEIVECLSPWRMASHRRARAVLELSAGESARRGVRIGDQLGLRDRRPTPKTEEPGRDASRRDDANEAANIRRPPAHAASSESIIWPSEPGGNSVQSVREPRRVLVVSCDRHFRSVTSMLLSHRGCVVSTTSKTTQAAELAKRTKADVVVLDAAANAATAETVAAVAELAQRVGIVVVDEVSSDAQPPSVVGKWGPFEDLLAAIAQADEQRRVCTTGRDAARGHASNGDGRPRARRRG